MDKKYFPIKTATACQLKWTWSTLFLYSGSTASCHRIVPEPLPLEDFNNFHNTAKKLNDRKLMLDGQWPTGGCEYCQKIEQENGSSDRMMHLKIPDLSPPELDHDVTAIAVTPRILEIYLNNTCNFSCVYCNGQNSSRINHENEKFKGFQERNEFDWSFKVVPSNQQSEYMAKLLSWLDENSTSLRRLHVLGGEPFYQQEFTTLLDFLSSHKNPHLEFNIVSNLGISSNKLRLYVEKLKQLVIDKKIRRVEITCSIDCWGPQQEFVRHGLDLALWEENFNYLLEQRWLVLNINQTISPLTIKTMPELLMKLRVWNQIRPVGHYFSGVTPGPSYLKPDIFGGEIFQKDFETILSLMATESQRDQQAREYMEGIWLQISKSDVNIKEIENLKTFLDEIDRRRNTNWKQLFPWIGE